MASVVGCEAGSGTVADASVTPDGAQPPGDMDAGAAPDTGSQDEDASVDEDAGPTCDLACENGGTCLDTDGEARCECPVDFQGTTCEQARPTGLAERPSNAACVAPATPEQADMLTKLSDTGCFDDEGKPVDALIPYTLRAPLWSDAAEKHRYLALPDGTAATMDDAGDFIFPVGTVLVKEFTLADVRVETRLFVLHEGGEWGGYSYTWIDEDGELLADAELLADTEDPQTREVPDSDAVWTYPTREQCHGCHTEAANHSLGVEVGHLNFEADYPGDQRANQLYTLWKLGMVEGDIAFFADLAYPAYDDETVPLADRVWSYLNSNCSNCHYRTGGRGSLGRSSMPDVRFDLWADPDAPHWLEQKLCGVDSTSDDIGLGRGAPLILPGNPGDWSDLEAGGSVVYLRMSARPSNADSDGTMPPIGTAVTDADGGLALVAEWIRQLQCP